MEDADRWSAIRDFLLGWLTHQHECRDIPGFAVHVAHGSTATFSHAFGVADIAAGTPLTVEHQLNLGSQAKLVTALVVMRLVDEAKIDLDAPASTYIDWLLQHDDDRMRSITVRDLLAHRGGLRRDTHNADYWQGLRTFPDSAELKADVLSSGPVVEQAEWKYSNLGYALLGQIVEAVVGTSFGEYVDAYVRQILPHRSVSEERPLARSYGRELQPFDLPDQFSAYAAVAGLYLTVVQSSQLLTSCSQADAVSREVWQTMRTPTGDFHPTATRAYGLGVEILDFDGRTMVGHSGGFLGYRSCTFVDEDRSVVVSIAANSIEAPILEMSRGVFGVIDHFWNGAAESSFDGVFQNAWETFHIVTTPGRIVSIDPASWTPFRWINEEFAPAGRDTLRVTMSRQDQFRGESLHFLRDGHIQEVRLAGVTAVRVS